jgi:hypothetical protein
MKNDGPHINPTDRLCQRNTRMQSPALKRFTGMRLDNIPGDAYHAWGRKLLKLEPNKEKMNEKDHS